VREVLERVWQRGDIYKADYEGFYCVDCEEYKDEGDMDAGGLRSRPRLGAAAHARAAGGAPGDCKRATLEQGRAPSASARC
jgi:hypothetical protein